MTSPLLASSTMHRFVRYDARREILDAIGDLKDLDLFGTQIICAPYVHSGVLWSSTMGFPLEERLSLERLYALYEGTKGFVSQQDPKESIYTGKVMLVVKPGEETGMVKPGDWVFTLQENTRMVSIQTPTSKESRVLKFIGINYVAGWPCKLCYEADIYGRIPYPDMVV